MVTTYMIWHILALVFLPTRGALEASFLRGFHDIIVIQTLPADCTLAKVAENNFTAILTHDAEL